MTLTLDKAAELRKEFPAEAIGKKPQPYKADATKGQCKDCGGWHGLPAAHLDFVGHAATTDRLLQVDPEWSWEPMATDPHGLPMTDAKGNLWIRLTVCGVTRIGVGDGKSAKECIGDAIRNAAMRFGVALDLWSKEELEQATTKGTRTRKAAESPPLANEPAEPTRRMSRPDSGTSPAQRKMFALLGQTGRAEKSAALAFICGAVGRDIETRNDLTPAELTKVIQKLEAEIGEPA